MPRKLRFLGLLFLPFLLPHIVIIYLRNKFYDWQLLKTCRMDTPVISVGNIQIGGTGKTPFVEYVTKLLLKTGISVAILTRGYKRKSKQSVIVETNDPQRFDPKIVGDEPYLLKQNLPKVLLGIDRDRCSVAKKIQKRYTHSFFVLDDGFQHRRMPRDVDIVLIDPDKWSRLPFLFPLTNFRDLKASLKRASIVVINRRHNLDNKAADAVAGICSKYNIPLFSVKFKPLMLKSLFNEDKLTLNKIRNKKVAAFCGIANPEQFLEMISECGALLCWYERFRDHHQYSEADLERILTKAKINNAEIIITTQKDVVKFYDFLDKINDPFYYLRTELVLNDEKAFWKAVLQVLRPKLPKDDTKKLKKIFEYL
jgi:tetraacyldisaccharide 4'-kinase